MAVPIQGQVGPQVVQDGVTAVMRQGRSAEQIIGELHGRFYEQVFRGYVFSAGSGVTALSATTITLTATSTPIVGVWNPASSTVNLVILQLAIQSLFNTWTTPTGSGVFLIATSVGNTAVSTGAAPFNRKTLASSGSQAKAFNGGVALTGLTNNVVILEEVDIPGIQGTGAYGTISAPTAAFFTSVGGVQNFDGSLIVPPGGVLSILNQTSTTTVSVASRLLWEEVPL